MSNECMEYPMYFVLEKDDKPFHIYLQGLVQEAMKFEREKSSGHLRDRVSTMWLSKEQHGCSVSL